VNRLARIPQVSAFRILGDQLTGIVVLLLIAAGAVSVLMGDRIEAAAIGAVLVINTSASDSVRPERLVWSAVKTSPTGHAWKRNGNAARPFAKPGVGMVLRPTLRWTEDVDPNVTRQAICRTFESGIRAWWSARLRVISGPREKFALLCDRALPPSRNTIS
jgi:hypothetical protein